MKVVVLGGGNSPEREVSLRSARAVADAARQAGFKVKEADPKDGLDFLYSLSPLTVVLPILHGKNGEDGVIQAELEKWKVPYLGSDSRSSARCFDKWQTRQDLKQAGLPVAKGALVSRTTYSEHELAKSPHVLKVNHGGSSIGTLIVRDPANLDKTEVDKLFDMENEAVLEELIEGIEATVPILDQSALTPIEVVPPKGLEFDYENKYNGQTQEICPPNSISLARQYSIKKLAEDVHKVMGCKHLSRVDMIIRPDGKVFVLEINTIPGLTDQSLYPKSAAVDGLSTPQLVSRFVELVKRDFWI